MWSQNIILAKPETSEALCNTVRKKNELILQGVPYVLGRTLESLGPIMLTFWIFLLNYAKKQTFQWLIWCKLLFCSCTFIKDTGENVQHHFATLLYNLISKITIVIQTYKKSLNDQKWDLNWILGHWVQFWVLKR